MIRNNLNRNYFFLLRVGEALWILLAVLFFLAPGLAFSSDPNVPPQSSESPRSDWQVFSKTGEGLGAAAKQIPQGLSRQQSRQFLKNAFELKKTAGEARKVGQITKDFRSLEKSSLTKHASKFGKAVRVVDFALDAT